MSWCIAVSDLKSPVAAAGAGTVLRHSASGKLRGRTPVNVDEQSDLICALRPVFADELPADHIGGFMAASLAERSTYAAQPEWRALLLMDQARLAAASARIDAAVSLLDEIPNPTERDVRVLASEMLWVWAPALVLIAVCVGVRRLHTRHAS